MRGVHTALVTPFVNDAVDEAALDTLIERQLRAGVDGLVPCGTTGESVTLEPAEWELVVSRAVALGRGRAFVTAGCGTNSTRSTVKNVERAAALGVNAALIVLPYYNKPNPAGHKAHLQAALEVGLPVVVYHVPGRTGQRLSLSLLTELCGMPGVIACKEATGDLQLGSDLIAATSVSVLSGDDFTWLPLLSVGGRGVISVLSNVDPVRCVALSRAVAEGRWDDARALHHALMPLTRFLFSDSNPVPCKAALASLGLCKNELRLPLAAGASPTAALLADVKA
ncbi:MAG: 4-hydroxy-tetrahydrodipicolinate synthase [Deltaproteobacteria bacterium]|nr:4-hydroxy-tetrahydrodipicolinate synthase [Deltaproteobacteria bacterium]